MTATTIAITASNLRVEIAHEADGLRVEARYTGAGIDRPELAAWGLGHKHAPLAARLKAALEAGAVFTSATVKADVNGRSYLTPNWTLFLLGRTLNADLRRLGF